MEIRLEVKKQEERRKVEHCEQLHANLLAQLLLDCFLKVRKHRSVSDKVV